MTNNIQKGVTPLRKPQHISDCSLGSQLVSPVFGATKDGMFCGYLSKTESCHSDRKKSPPSSSVFENADGSFLSCLGKRQRSSFSLVLMPSLLLKRLFFPVCVWHFCQESLSVDTWVYCLHLHSLPSAYMPGSM